MNYYLYNSNGQHVHSEATKELAEAWARRQYKLWHQSGAPRVPLYSVHYNGLAGTPSEVIPEVPPSPTARERIFMDYECDSANRITNPGKFEGEPIFAPHFWSVALEGFADSDDGNVYRFKFKRGDAELVTWPELKAWLGRRRTLSMSENEQGFVHCF